MGKTAIGRWLLAVSFKDSTDSVKANQFVKITGLPDSPVVTTIGGTYGFVVGDISSIH